MDRAWIETAQAAALFHGVMTGIFIAVAVGILGTLAAVLIELIAKHNVKSWIKKPRKGVLA